MEIYNKKERIQYVIDDTIISNNNEYEILENIDNGGNGSVFSCLDSNGIEYAVKFLLNHSNKGIKRFEQEIKLMQLVNHPHLINYIDSGVIESYIPKNNDYCELKYVIMQKADGNLRNYIIKHDYIPYNEYAPQFSGLCGALSELHKYAIHRDIKPENILIRGSTWVLSDFGLCEFIDPELHNDITGVFEKVGPQFWMSPEAINSHYFGLDEISKRSDVFQLCSVFAFVLNRRYPGGILNADDINTTEPIKDLILSSLSYNTKLRPSDGSDLYKKIIEATVYYGK